MLVCLKKADYSSLSLSMVKTHLRLNHSDEDDYLMHTIEVAGEIVEKYLGQSLLEKTWRFLWQNTQDGLPFLMPLGQDIVTIVLPFPPVCEIQSIHGIMPGGKLKDIKRYSLVNQGHRAEVKVARGYPVIEITYVAGMAKKPVDLPACLQQALLHMVAYLYEHRQSQEMSNVPILSHLLKPFLSRGLA